MSSESHHCDDCNGDRFLSEQDYWDGNHCPACDGKGVKQSPPSLDEYDGGGTILNGYTTLRNVIATCQSCTESERDEVFRLLRLGSEVIVLQGKIVAVNSSVQELEQSWTEHDESKF